MFGRCHLNGFASSTSSSCFQLASGQGRTTQPLRSSPITGPSTLLRAAPLLRPASVLSPSRLEPLAACPFTSLGRDEQPWFPRSSLQFQEQKCDPRPCGASLGASRSVSIAPESRPSANSVEAQVLTFHTKAWSSFAPPTRRMPLGQYQGIPRADPGGRSPPGSDIV